MARKNAMPEKNKMTPTDESDQQIKSRLRDAGLRVTAVRLGALRVLAGARAGRGGLNAHEVFAALESATADRVTVYRTLNSLVEAGLAHRVDPGDRVYRFSLTPHHTADHSEGHPGRQQSGPHASESESGDHPHFVCDECGNIRCLDDADVVIMPRNAGSVAAKLRVSQQNVMLHGTCDDCEPAEGTAQSTKSPRSSSKRGSAASSAPGRRRRPTPRKR